jgi:hypothetical protein
MQHSAQIRALVYERLRKPLMSHIAPLEQVASDVGSAAEHSGIVEKAPPFSGLASLDWGVCGNPACPPARLLTFEHEGCAEFGRE